MPNIQLPRAQTPAEYGGKAAINFEWFRFFRSIYQAFGYDPKAPMWAELYVPQFSMDITDASGSMAVLDGGVKQFRVSSGDSAPLYFNVRLPNGYRPGTPLYPWVDWAQDGTGAGSVFWRLEYIVNSAATAGTAVENDILVTAPGTDATLVKSDFAAIPGTGLVRGASISCAIWRMGADGADDCGDNSWLFGVGFKYQTEGVGHELAQP